MSRPASPAAASVARRLAELRAELDLSQAEFARRIGLRQSAISKYEKGYPVPEVVQIAIAAVFDVNLAWLQEGKRPKHVADRDAKVGPEEIEILHFIKEQHALYEVLRSHVRRRKRTAR